MNLLSLKPNDRLINSLSYQFELILHLVKRDFGLQYKRSILGAFWSLLVPLAQLLIFIFIFETVIPLNIDAYPLFLFCALLPWTWFNNCLNSAPGIFLWNRDLVLRPNFEPFKLVIVNVLTHFILFLIATPLLLMLIPIYDKGLSINLIYLPILIIIQAFLIFGLVIVIAILNVFFTDVQFIVSIGLSMLFFLTPIFYGLKNVGEKYTFFYLLNPLAAVIHNYRVIIFDGASPDWKLVSYAFIVSLIICIIGIIVYNRQIENVYDRV